MPRTKTTAPRNKHAKSYKHPESESPMRPEVGTQAEFKKKLPPKKYRYDDSLSPVVEWDGQNPARERGEARIAKAEVELAEVGKKLNGKSEAQEAVEHISAAQKAVGELKAMSKPFLSWAGTFSRRTCEPQSTRRSYPASSGCCISQIARTFGLRSFFGWQWQADSLSF